MKIAVVGRGLIGSAAARHLALAGLHPTLIGPGEPADKSTHRGVFASHYDEGRITRRIATEPFWAEAASAAIDRYAEIEAASGIRFHNPVGALMMGHESGNFLAAARRTAKVTGVICDDLRAEDLVGRFAFLAPEGRSALHESGNGAGHISPRQLVAAQTKAAERAGARLLAATVDAIEAVDDGVTLRIEGETHRFDRVLVAGGGMTDHILGRSPRLRVYARTIALLRLGESETERLAQMPSIVMDDGHYVLPPIRYPNGGIYLKIGGDPTDIQLEFAAEISDWFRSGGNPEVRDALAARLFRLVPGLAVDEVRMDACVTTWTADERPEIRALTPSLAVATAGCGQGAKCSDELGRRAAMLFIEERELA